MYECMSRKIKICKKPDEGIEIPRESFRCCTITVDECELFKKLFGMSVCEVPTIRSPECPKIRNRANVRFRGKSTELTFCNVDALALNPTRLFYYT